MVLRGHFYVMGLPPLSGKVFHFTDGVPHHMGLGVCVVISKFLQLSKTTPFKAGIHKYLSFRIRLRSVVVKSWFFLPRLSNSKETTKDLFFS